MGWIFGGAMALALLASFFARRSGSQSIIVLMHGLTYLLPGVALLAAVGTDSEPLAWAPRIMGSIAALIGAVYVGGAVILRSRGTEGSAQR